MACFRGFYRFLVVSGHRPDNPAVDVRAPRAWKTLPKFLSVDEVDRLLGSPDTSQPRGLRDRALIELFYATGLRVSEMVSLRQQDLNLESGYLTTHRQGPQAAAGADRRRGVVLADALPEGGPAGAA